MAMVMAMAMVGPTNSNNFNDMITTIVPGPHVPSLSPVYRILNHDDIDCIVRLRALGEKFGP